MRGGQWNFQTEYSRIPRLRGLAVEGRQRACRGMPNIHSEDVEAIAMAILSLRGADKTKHKQASEECELRFGIEAVADARNSTSFAKCERTR